MTAAALKLVEDNLALVEPIARRLARSMARSIEMDDIIQTGRMGLMQAAERHDPEKGEFAHHACMRIRGAILDQFRRRNYDYELHAELSDNIVEVRESAEAKVHRRQLCQHVRHALSTLSDEDQRILAQREVEEQTLKAIGERKDKSTTWAFYKSHCARGRMKRALERRGISGDCK